MLTKKMKFGIEAQAALTVTHAATTRCKETRAAIFLILSQSHVQTDTYWFPLGFSRYIKHRVGYSQITLSK